jgi:hypothetical protein
LPSQLRVHRIALVSEAKRRQRTEAVGCLCPEAGEHDLIGNHDLADLGSVESTRDPGADHNVVVMMREQRRGASSRGGGTDADGVDVGCGLLARGLLRRHRGGD